ncbi:GL23264 [Drosophila persimilis]|uniref:GL23264 n=1 Tax=Drosophila persimilis TaxID=7234 RepID=B4HBK9_DROPE|nr:GL23264 [Drosophila persimilis]
MDWHGDSDSDTDTDTDTGFGFGLRLNAGNSWQQEEEPARTKEDGGTCADLKSQSQSAKGAAGYQFCLSRPDFLENLNAQPLPPRPGQPTCPSGLFIGAALVSGCVVQSLHSVPSPMFALGAPDLNFHVSLASVSFNRRLGSPFLEKSEQLKPEVNFSLDDAAPVADAHWTAICGAQRVSGGKGGQSRPHIRTLETASTHPPTTWSSFALVMSDTIPLCAGGTFQRTRAHQNVDSGRVSATDKNQKTVALIFPYGTVHCFKYGLRYLSDLQSSCKGGKYDPKRDYSAPGPTLRP